VMQFYEHFGGGVQPVQKVVRVQESGRIRLTIPGRRNLPPEGVTAPGLMVEPRPGTLAPGQPAPL